MKINLSKMVQNDQEIRQMKSNSESSKVTAFEVSNEAKELEKSS